MNEWDFTRIYKDLNAFEEDAKKLSEDIDGYNKFKGKINDEKSLLDFLNYDEEVVGNFSKIYTYASINNKKNLLDKRYMQQQTTYTLSMYK